MKRNVSLTKRNRESSGIGVWSIIGGVALVAAVALAYTSYPDIRRYIKISTM